jgi:hypothetical protein
MMNAVSRTKRFWLRVAMVALGASACVSEADAQIGWAPDGEVCTAERTVCGVVTEKKTCVRWKPVTQVCMKRQDCVTYRDECRVGYRPEQYVQCVPKTVYDTVTVDEGCWKMVWVPKPVQKCVARQTVEKRVACRNVPYTYTEKVPQVVSKWVPEYKTAYVPEQYQTVERRPFSQALPSQTTAMMPPSCATPMPSCAMPAEASCATPMLGGMPGAAPTMAPIAPTPTYAPPAGGTPSYEPSGGPVPNPTPDPLSYYPSKSPQTTSTDSRSGSATWTSVAARKSDSGLTASTSSSLASLWQ